LGFRFRIWIGVIAIGLGSRFGETGSLYPFKIQIEFFKSKIRNPNSKIYRQSITATIIYLTQKNFGTSATEKRGDM